MALRFDGSRMRTGLTPSRQTNSFVIRTIVVKAEKPLSSRAQHGMTKKSGEEIGTVADA
jgi:hypothetical protein